MYWYVLSTKRKSEIKISSELEIRGYEVYCPTITVVKQWSDRKKKVISPLLSSYIFIKIDDKDRTKVFEVPGVLKYLFYLGVPAKVFNKEIELLKNHIDGNSLKASIDSIKPGDNHIISSGPFKGQKGEVKEAGNNRIQVVLTELGIKVTLTNTI